VSSIPAHGEGIQHYVIKFASDLLIPAEKNEQLKNLTSEESIKSFAKEMGIHSGIVVGRLQLFASTTASLMPL
jgi:hypothetical protein